MYSLIYTETDIGLNVYSLYMLKGTYCAADDKLCARQTLCRFRNSRYVYTYIICVVLRTFAINTRRTWQYARTHYGIKTTKPRTLKTTHMFHTKKIYRYLYIQTTRCQSSVSKQLKFWRLFSGQQRRTTDLRASQHDIRVAFDMDLFG